MCKLIPLKKQELDDLQKRFRSKITKAHRTHNGGLLLSFFDDRLMYQPSKAYARKVKELSKPKRNVTVLSQKKVKVPVSREQWKQCIQMVILHPGEIDLIEKDNFFETVLNCAEKMLDMHKIAVDSLTNKSNLVNVN